MNGTTAGNEEQVYVKSTWCIETSPRGKYKDLQDQERHMSYDCSTIKELRKCYTD